MNLSLLSLRASIHDFSVTRASTDVFSVFSVKNGAFSRTFQPIFRLSVHQESFFSLNTFKNCLGASIVLDSVNLLGSRLEPCFNAACQSSVVIEDCKFLDVYLLNSYACVHVSSTSSTLSAKGCTFYRIFQGNETAGIFTSARQLNVTRSCFIHMGAFHLSASGYGGAALSHRGSEDTFMTQCTLNQVPLNSVYSHAAVLIVGSGKKSISCINATEGYSRNQDTWISYLCIHFASSVSLKYQSIKNYTNSHLLWISMSSETSSRMEDSMFINNYDNKHSLFVFNVPYSTIERCVFHNNAVLLFRILTPWKLDIIDCIFTPSLEPNHFDGVVTANTIRLVEDDPQNYPDLRVAGVSTAECTYGFPTFSFTSTPLVESWNHISLFVLLHLIAAA